MIYLLDTNICIYWLKGRQEIMNKMLCLNSDDIAISIITLAELQYGAYNSANVEDNLQRVKEFESSLNTLDLDKDCVDTYAKVKASLKSQGKMLDDFDILIAAIALVNECILVTNNVKHFERVERLRIENWIKS
ncbi:MAG: type II toxin-antitoxin system VapC family toxin [Thermincola sp.]|jgi:tRNA(fMet)-specific endonuclease VapC|nr:type II toxin-antitoxin system VapC family toxin [Thermincola sp.]MDT3704474.1 type II toxin-antitoxin system VapC family toxin [Thermincola sp.]